MNNIKLDRFKFRVWNGKEMLYQFTIAGAEYCDTLQVMTNEEFAKKYYKQEEWKIMQCIGLTDSESNLIYEGDIVEVSTTKDAKPYLYQVIFKGMGFWFMDDEEELFIFHPQTYYLKVIGNIYKNGNTTLSE